MHCLRWLQRWPHPRKTSLERPTSPGHGRRWRHPHGGGQHHPGQPHRQGAAPALFSCQCPAGPRHDGWAAAGQLDEGGPWPRQPAHRLRRPPEGPDGGCGPQRHGARPCGLPGLGARAGQRSRRPGPLGLQNRLRHRLSARGARSGRRRALQLNGGAGERRHRRRPGLLFAALRADPFSGICGRAAQQQWRALQWRRAGAGDAKSRPRTSPSSPSRGALPRSEAVQPATSRLRRPATQAARRYFSRPRSPAPGRC